jgi:hypothetical protein
MATPEFFEFTEPDDGITYYIIPAGTPLFRGDVPPNPNSPLEHINGPVFFGQTADVALTYGIPFEFKTKSELRLLALDKSMGQIYNDASNNNASFDGEAVNDVIPKILKRNYGYNGGVRNSDDAADKKLTNYICQRFPGYATYFMDTDFSGKFHPEIVICDKNNVDFVRQLTTVNGEPVDVETIKAEQKLRKLAKNDADNRAQKKQRPNAPPSSAKKSYAMELSFDSDEEDGQYAIPPPIFDDSESDGEGGPNVYPDAVPRPSYAKNLFGFDGGKSRKRIKSHKKQMRNKHRKTHKKGKPKKASRKRK